MAANPSGVELAGSDLDTSGGGFDLAVTEGASGAFTVRLSSDPGASTTVKVRLVKAQYNQTGFGKSGHVWDISAASVSPETLTFTGGNSGNFGAPQTVNVTGVEDDDVRPEQLIILLFGVGPSGENVPVGGSGNSITGVFVTIADDDCNNCSTRNSPSRVRIPVPEEQQPPQQQSPPQQQQADVGPEPANVRVTPGDGTLTVSWTVTPRDGVADEDIRHALRWSQQSGVWANPTNRWAGGPEDGIALAGGVYSYTITGLENGVATGVFVRSFTGGSHSERSEHSSEWVRTKGEHTTPVAGQQEQQQEQETPNRAPTVAAALGDVTLINGLVSGAKIVSLSGVFSDADGDELTFSAASSDETVALAWIATDGSGVEILGDYRGTATVTVTASDGNGGTVSDSFTVTVKAAPVVASALADVSSLEAGAEQFVLLPGVFSDADGDSLSISASSSDEARATVTVASDGSRLTVTGVAAGTATITVTAKDSDGNRVSDAFDVTVVKAPEPQDPDPQQQVVDPPANPHAALIAQVSEWRNDPQWVSYKAHTDRWDRVLLALGETVADATLTPMTAAEAQVLADKGWSRWVEVAAALKALE